MEKSNHVSYPVPSVRKYDFTAPNLAPAPRDPRDIASYCRGRGPGRSGLNLKADPSQPKVKLPIFPPVFLPMLSIMCVPQSFP
jgi:hypothetical protein